MWMQHDGAPPHYAVQQNYVSTTPLAPLKSRTCTIYLASRPRLGLQSAADSVVAENNHPRARQVNEPRVSVQFSARTTSTMTSSSTLDGLPKQFVAAMRTLFDIMDDKKTGFVNFADIENRWQDDDAKGLPKGVIESLRKVTPPNGMLSFERFCAGLKICLLRNQVERREKQQQETGVKPNRPPSAPLLDIDSPPKQNWGNTAAIRPNNVISQQRTLSMPQLLPERKDNNLETVEKPVPNVNKPTLYGPPKPPRTAIGIERGASTGNMDRAEIRTALQNWQMGLMMNDQENKGGNTKRQGPQQYAGEVLRSGRSLGMERHRDRREPRRHTLQNGIDYNMLKRMKQIEQEKEVLMQGLSAVEKAREWYLKQVAVVQEKMKYLGRMGHVEHWSEAQQERLELQRARVLKSIGILLPLQKVGKEEDYPSHESSCTSLPQAHQPQDLSDRLKQQNRLSLRCRSKQNMHITFYTIKQARNLHYLFSTSVIISVIKQTTIFQEVSKKSERISALEQEKASLIQVLQTRSAPPNRSNGQEEAVF
ncbi:hypothetical protein NQ317_000899 [Molorchus minor]|uniref:Suppressor APC domain-containing protein n=1 Tax=Molorchus minor TaxID=1323400 RepID=A0ABQ9JLH8_9CUCU|nr:hypothetical protein NQ317_000899 [Molorchus minor]